MSASVTRPVEPLFRAVVRPYRLGPLLLAIAEQRLSGHLLLSSDMVERTIHFRAGMPVFSHSTQFGERLGPIAVRMELITREQLARALATARSRELELGRALISLEMVSGAQLFALLGEQLVQQVGAACCTGARARFFADRRDGLPLLRLHPMTGVMAGVRAMGDAERTKLLEGIRARKVVDRRLPAVVSDWLDDVGFQGAHDELLQHAPTFGQVCARLAQRLHPGTRHRFARPEQELPKKKKKPGVSTAPFGTHTRRKISSMQMLAVQSPPLDADAADLIALSLMFAGCIELETPAQPPSEPSPKPRALSAEEALAVLDHPSQRPPPALRDAVGDTEGLAPLVEAYLYERRPPDVAARMAVWGPGLEVSDADGELLGTYLSIIHDSDPYHVLGVDSRATGGTVEQMRDRQLARLEHAQDAPILVRAKAAELRQCVLTAYERLSIVVAPRVVDGAREAAADDAGDAGAREAERKLAAAEAELLERAQRLMFAGDYPRLKSLLGPDEHADALPAPLRLAYALACSEVARSEGGRDAAVQRAQQALGELMASGGHRTSAFGLWGVGHRTERRPRRGRVVLALVAGVALGAGAVHLAHRLGLLR